MCINCVVDEFRESIQHHLSSMATDAPETDDVIAAMAACGTVMSNLLAMIQAETDRERMLGDWLEILRKQTKKTATELDAKEAADARAAGQMN